MQACKNLWRRARSKEGEDVSCADNHVKGLSHSAGRQIQLCQVSHQPHRPWVGCPRRFDQLGVRVNSHHGMATQRQFPANPALPAAGVENTRISGSHCVDAPGFPV